MTDGTVHSRIGASSMERWANCAGSVQANAGIHSKSSSYAEEGTRAHDVAQKTIADTGVWDASVFAESPDMAEAVQVYVDHARELFQRTHAVCLVEHKFHLKDIHPDLFGTADLVVMDVADGVLYVRDYKHGAGKAVEVLIKGSPNYQLMYYAAGALLSNPQWRPKHVDIGIVQPRCPHTDGPIRTHRIAVVDLMEFISFLETAVKATEAPDAPRTVGDWCRWCPAAGTPCPALSAFAQEEAKRVFSDDEGYDPQALSEALENAPILSAYVKSLHEFAYAEALVGRGSPDHKLVDKEGRRKYRDEKDAADLCRMLGFEEKDIFEEPKMRSPAQLEKVLEKPDRPLLKAMVVKVSSGLALVHKSDKRPAAKVDAATAFADLIDEEETET